MSTAAIAWAENQNFSLFTSADTIICAYEAHIRIMAKIAARNVA